MDRLKTYERPRTEQFNEDLIELLGESLRGAFDFGVDGKDAEYDYQYELARHMEKNLAGIVIIDRDDLRELVANYYAQGPDRERHEFKARMRTLIEDRRL